MPDIIIDFIKAANPAQLLCIGLMIWFFYNRLDKKIEKLDVKLSDRIDKLDVKIDKVDVKLSDRIDKLSEKVEDVDRRLCRIEGSLAMQGHCLFTQRAEKKVE